MIARSALLRMVTECRPGRWAWAEEADRPLGRAGSRVWAPPSPPQWQLRSRGTGVWQLVGRRRASSWTARPGYRGQSREMGMAHALIAIDRLAATGLLLFAPGRRPRTAAPGLSSVQSVICMIRGQTGAWGLHWAHMHGILLIFVDVCHSLVAMTAAKLHTHSTPRFFYASRLGVSSTLAVMMY